MEKKYVLEVQLTPQIHEGNMAYYWHIALITSKGRYTARDGWGNNYHNAHVHAQHEAKKLGLI